MTSKNTTAGTVQVNSILPTINGGHVLRTLRGAFPAWKFESRRTFTQDARCGYPSCAEFAWKGEASVTKAREALLAAFNNDADYDFIRTKLKKG